MTTTTASAPLLLVALVLASVLFLSATAARRPPVSTCTQELVLISPCLPYISAPPNKLSEAPSEKCCDALSLTMNSSRSGVCLCYLVLEPMILGFPVNGARVLSLCRVCMRLRDGSSSRSISLASLCSGSRRLPPLWNATGSGHTNPPGSGSNNVSSPAEPERNSSATPSSLPDDNAAPPTAKASPSPPDANASPPKQNSSMEPDTAVTVSSGAKQLHLCYSWVPSGVFIFLVGISPHLYSW